MEKRDDWPLAQQLAKSQIFEIYEYARQNAHHAYSENYLRCRANIILHILFRADAWADGGAPRLPVLGGHVLHESFAPA